MSVVDVTGKWKDCPTTGALHPAVFVDEVDAANLTADPPSLVTIQAGADDINFAGCLTYALGFPGILGGIKCTDGNHVTKHVADILSNVTTGLSDTIKYIDRQTQTKTRIAVVNYYEPIPARADFVSDGSQLCTALDAHNKGNEVYHEALTIQKALNDAIAKGVSEATQAGDPATVIDVSNVFGGLGTTSHGICTAQPMLFTGSLLDGKFWRAVHPTIGGQAAIAKVVEAKLVAGD